MFEKNRRGLRLATLGLLLPASMAGCARAPAPRPLPQKSARPPSAFPQVWPEWKQISAFALSPDSQDIVVASQASLRFFSVRFARLYQNVTMERTVRHIAFSHDGRWLAVDEEGSTGPSRCFLLDRATVRTIRVLHGAEDYAELAFTADDRYLIAASYGGIFKWRVPDGLETHAGVPKPEFFGCDATLIPAADGWSVLVRQRSATLYDPATMRPAARPIRASDAEDFAPAVFLEHGRPSMLAKPGPFAVIDLLTGRTVRIFARDRALTRAIRQYPSVAAAPDGALIGVRSEDTKTLSVYSLNDGSLVRTLSADRRVIGEEWRWLSPSVIAAPLDYEKSQLALWHVPSGKLALTIAPDLRPWQFERQSLPAWIAFTPEGDWTGTDAGLRLHHGVELKGEPSRAAVTRAAERLFGSPRPHRVSRGPAGAGSEAWAEKPASPRPAALARWPWAGAVRTAPHAGIVHWASRAAGDGGALDLYQVDFASGRLGLELYDRDQDDGRPFDDAADLSGRGAASAARRLEADGGGRVLAAWNGVFFNADNAARAHHVAPVVRRGDVHYNVGNPRWTFGAQLRGGRPVFKALYRPDRATMRRQFTFGAGGAQCLLRGGRALPLGEDGPDAAGIVGGADLVATSRTSMAWSRDSRYLWVLIVKKERGPRFGWTLADLQSFWSSAHVWGAVNLDGGRYSELYSADEPSRGRRPADGSLMYFVVREAPGS